MVFDLFSIDLPPFPNRTYSKPADRLTVLPLAIKGGPCLSPGRVGPHSTVK